MAHRRAKGKGTNRDAIFCSKLILKTFTGNLSVHTFQFNLL